MSKTPSLVPSAHRRNAWIATGLVAGAVLAAGSAGAQSASSTLSSYRIGYGPAGLSGLQSPVNLSVISAGSQFTISDGVNQAGAVGSVFAAQTPGSQTSTTQTPTTQTSGGAGQTYTGVGQLAASNERAPVAVADNASPAALSYHATTTAAKAQIQAQSTTASPAGETATTEIVLNGKIDLDGGQ